MLRRIAGQTLSPGREMGEPPWGLGSPQRLKRESSTGPSAFNVAHWLMGLQQRSGDWPGLDMKIVSGSSTPTGPLSGAIDDQLICRYHRYMTMYMANLDPSLGRGAALFHGLADRNRLAIVRQLTRGERRVVDLTEALTVAQGTVSGHVACLRDCGLIVGRPEGRQIFYSIAHPELMELLGAAEQLLALTGEAVELCPTYGTNGSPSIIEEVAQ